MRKISQFFPVYCNPKSPPPPSLQTMPYATIHRIYIIHRRDCGQDNDNQRKQMNGPNCTAFPNAYQSTNQ